jgi:formylglycine-generating enzyme required for sulfatase activity
VKQYILLSILFSALISGCASAPKADRTPASAEKPSAAAAASNTPAVAVTTPAAPVASTAPAAAEQQGQPSSAPVQKESSEASAKPMLVKEDKQLVNESAIKGPPIVPEMVRIPGKTYEIGKYEVTQAQWISVMGNNPSKFKNCGDMCPVEKVSWDDAQVYIQRLNEKTGKQFRLPTEAEWEYACYGGNQSEYCGGDDADAVAWTDSRGNEETHPVGQKKANGYGLYDMSGNVMEWTTDCWEGNCAQRVFRGGSWLNSPHDVRVSYRIRYATVIRNSSGGFRLAMTVQ